MKAIFIFIFALILKSSASENDTIQILHLTSPICEQPQMRGECKALLRRYFYHSSSGVCKEFFYGGCGGNENNFMTRFECESTCLKNVSAILPVLNSNGKSGICPSLDIGNSHESCNISCNIDSDCSDHQKCCYIDSCNGSICIDTTENDTQIDTSPAETGICGKPLATGPCRAYFLRFGYNGTKCVQFIYGGCEGNENNFDILQSCQSVCEDRTTMPACPMIKIVPPPGCEVVPDAYIQNGCPMPLIKCTEGACAGNQCQNECEICINEPKQCFATPCPQYRCESRPNCHAARIASVQIPLQMSIPASSTVSACSAMLCPAGKMCREMQGLASCVPDPMTASNASPRARSVCQSSADVGHCRASMERWFFNIRTSKCEIFIYGGCAGNENNFESRQSCESFCSPFMVIEKPGQCPFLDSAIGSCLVQCEKDADCDAQEKCCSNGCGRLCVDPNTTADLHSKRLVPPKMPASLDVQRKCRQIPATGECRGSFQRYFFNSQNGQCQLFMYGGCGGNTNNFQTLQECQQTCDTVQPCPLYNPPIPIPGCNLISWIGLDGCANVNYKCTAGECASQKCTNTCEFCINEPKQCVTTPCPQYKCQANETCLNEQCRFTKCNAETSCKVMNGRIGCFPKSIDIQKCVQPKDPGPCEAAIAQFYYNTISGQCEQFSYGGCQGNENRFNNLQECQRACSSGA